MKVLIIGGGIGGLSTALALHRRGIACEIYEQSESIRELGVGINTLPHAIAALVELGLFERLDAVGVRTLELIYMNRFGQEIMREPRGVDAGHPVPQFSIHRGMLQALLYQAVIDRLGPGAVRTSHRLVTLDQNGDGVTAWFAHHGSDDAAVSVRADALVAADGIHSTVRGLLYPSEGPPMWNGIILWRGATEWAPFLTGRSMIIAGGMAAKLVVYPICNDVGTQGRQLMNWVVAAKLGDGPPPRRENWSRPGRPEELLPFLEKFVMPVVDIRGLVAATTEFYEYPMCDRDPLPRWSHGRVTLLGDAAHPMYPVGSNGASQAVLDAMVLADSLAAGGTVEAALTAYDADRRPKTAEVVRSNRQGGPERVIDIVESRAPDGFRRIEDVISRNELNAVVRGYAQLAGFDAQRPAQ